MEKTMIRALKGYTLTESDALDMTRLLIKNGYTARVAKIKPEGKPKAPSVRVVVFWEEEP